MMEIIKYPKITSTPTKPRPICHMLTHGSVATLMITVACITRGIHAVVGGYSMREPFLPR
jgi:hypothetical protein